ncbi:hypothetical protein DIPPA_70135 [Diplonema papillatum]|nr:hypothetical protein DIPPA_70135 [Diplonema papillatum]
MSVGHRELLSDVTVHEDEGEGAGSFVVCGSEYRELLRIAREHVTVLKQLFQMKRTAGNPDWAAVYWDCRQGLSCEDARATSAVEFSDGITLYQVLDTGHRCELEPDAVVRISHTRAEISSKSKSVLGSFELGDITEMYHDASQRVLVVRLPSSSYEIVCYDQAVLRAMYYSILLRHEDERKIDAVRHVEQVIDNSTPRSWNGGETYVNAEFGIPGDYLQTPVANSQHLYMSKLSSRDPFQSPPSQPEKAGQNESLLPREEGPYSPQASFRYKIPPRSSQPQPQLDHQQVSNQGAQQLSNRSSHFVQQAASHQPSNSPPQLSRVQSQPASQHPSQHQQASQHPSASLHPFLQPRTQQSRHTSLYNSQPETTEPSQSPHSSQQHNVPLPAGTSYAESHGHAPSRIDSHEYASGIEAAKAAGEQFPGVPLSESIVLSQHSIRPADTLPGSRSVILKQSYSQSNEEREAYRDRLPTIQLAPPSPVEAPAPRRPPDPQHSTTTSVSDAETPPVTPTLVQA